jgi:ATP-dependent RNA helicase DeaD
MNPVKFEELGLVDELARAVQEMGFETATPIQAKSIPLIREGGDVIGRSQTGTGKTAAFLIPAIELILKSGTGKKPKILLLCPTRELALQAQEEAAKLLRHLRQIKTAAVYGGEPITRQFALLRRGVDIVVGTPGRVIDHLNRRTLSLEDLKMVILDEADEMLSMGFREDIEAVLSKAPEEVQTILFSATMPQEILDLTKKYQKDPQMVEIDRKQVTISAIEQSYYNLPMNAKADGLCTLLQYYQFKRVIVFCNTKKKVDELCEYLCDHQVGAQALHGDLKQAQRTLVMNTFKQGNLPVLIATDVAARGIDVDDVDVVVNYDIPQNSEYYVHRIGRTARAGKSGRAITLCSGRRQVGNLLDIARQTRSAIVKKDLPTGADIARKRDELHTRTLEAKLEGGIREDSYSDVIDALLEKGYSERQIAAAVLELLYGRQAVKEKEEAKQARDENYCKLMINIGKTHGIAPNFIVGAIAERADISGSEIGKIEIFDQKTVVGIPKDRAEQVIAAMKGCRINGRDTETGFYTGSEEPKPTRQNDNRTKYRPARSRQGRRHS